MIAALAPITKALQHFNTFEDTSTHTNFVSLRTYFVADRTRLVRVDCTSLSPKSEGSNNHIWSNGLEIVVIYYFTIKKW